MLTRKTCPICDSEGNIPFLEVKDHMISKEQFDIVSCVSCGFHFTNPVPDISEIGRYYKSEDYISHSSSTKGLVNKIYNLVRNFTLQQKIKIIKKESAGNNLLDIGAGSGHFISACKKKGYNIQGLEPDSDARNAVELNFGIKLEPIESLYQIEENTKDIITLWHVLEHVYYLNLDFQQIVKVLKDNGKLFIAVPNLESFDALHYQSYWAAYDVPRHLYHFRKKDIEFLANKYNLKLLTVKPMFFDSYYVSMLSEKYKNGSFINALKIGFLSNLKAKKLGYSSQIYILSKQ